MRVPPRLALPALALALAACQGAEPPPRPDPVPGSQATAGHADAGNAVAAPPPVLALTGTAAFSIVGPAAVPLSAAGETTVEPRAGFRVELPVAIPDARLSLLDGADAMVPSAGSRLVGPATVLTLTPTAALEAGARFRLRVDGAASRPLHAADGRRFEPLEWLVVVDGEPAAKPARGHPRTRR
jgi:hypothetical protein